MAETSVWHRTLVYLGLADELPGDVVDEQERDSSPSGDRSGIRPVRAPEERDASDRATDAWGGPRPASAGGSRAGSSGSVRTGSGRPRSSGDVAQLQGRAVVQRPRSFEDAEPIASRAAEGRAVLLDLSGVPAGDARRLLDFAAGVTVVLGARLRPAGPRAFLLLPEGVWLSSDDRERLQSEGYDVGETT